MAAFLTFLSTFGQAAISFVERHQVISRYESSSVPYNTRAAVFLAIKPIWKDHPEMMTIVEGNDDEVFNTSSFNLCWNSQL